MNILFLSTKSPYPLINGHSLRTYHILKGAAKNHKITLVTFVQQPDHELKDENIDHLKSICHAVYTFKVPLDDSRARLAAALFWNIFSFRPFVMRKYDLLAMRMRIRKILTTENIDLVHVDMLPLTVYIDEFYGKPKMLVNHNVESVRLYRWFRAENNVMKKIYLGMQWLKLRHYERSAVEMYDGCVVVSETDKQYFDKYVAHGRFHVISNGTNTQYFKPMKTRKLRNSVLWFGHMDVQTNKDAVLYFWREIYPILRKKHAEVQMRFVGTAPPVEISKTAEKDDRVAVTGFVEDIRPYVNEAVVVIIPIRIGSGTRLKILDAMAMGKAIVSTTIGCEGLNVTDGENILIADTPDDFSNKIAALLKDAGLRKRIECNARELAKSYDWDSLCLLQEKAYSEIMSANVYSRT